MRTRSLALAAAFIPALLTSAQRLVKYAEQDYFQLRDELRHQYDVLIASGDSSIYQEGGDFTEFKKWEDFWNHRLTPGVSFLDYELSYALSRADADAKSAESNTADWHEVGPRDIPFGTAIVGQFSGYGIGPIRFLTMNQDHPDTMLCGSYSGGLFYTLDEGMNWQSAGSDTAWAKSGCQHAVFKTDDPGTWYAANQYYWGYSGGIYRTNDYGANWTQIADQADFYIGGVWTYINQLVPDPSDGDVLYATSEHRLWRTENANDPDPAWQPVDIPLPQSLVNHPIYGGYNLSDVRGVYDMIIDPDHNDTLYVSVRFEGALNDTTKVRYWRLMSSFDRGANWMEIPNQPNPAFTLGIPHHRDEFRRWDRNAEHVTIEGTLFDHSRLFALYDMPGYQVGELWRCPVATIGQWDPSALRNTIQVTYGGGQAFGVSHTNGNDAYMDHNRTGTSVGRYLSYVNGQWYDYYDSPQYANHFQYHVDAEDFVTHPTIEGEVWLACHGGIYRSTDHAQTWEWRGKGLAVAEPLRWTDSYSEQGHVMMGLFHEATMLSQGDYEPNWDPDWKQLSGGDGQKPMIDPDEPNWMFWSSQGNGWHRSSDGGQNDISMYVGSGDWNTEGAIDRGSPNAIYIPGWIYHPNDSTNSSEIKRSFDHWATKETISDFYSQIGSGKLVWRVYPAWPDPNYLYAYFPDGPQLMRTTQARAAAQTVVNSWTELVGALPRTDAWVSDIDCDPEDPNILYIAYSSSAMGSNTAEGAGMLFRVDLADTANITFTDLTGSTGTWTPLPNAGVGGEALTIERGSNGGLYMGTDVGVYYTNTMYMANGTGWQLLGPNLPHTTCSGLGINYKANRLRAGMFGRGLWEHGLWCPDSLDLTESGTYAADAFLEASNDITATAVVPSARRIDYRAGHEVHLVPGFHAAVGSRFHAFIHPCDAGGNSFKSLVQQDPPPLEWDDRVRASTRDGSLYPNPNDGHFTIRKSSSTAIARATAMDALGRQLSLKVFDRGAFVECSLDPLSASTTVLITVEYMNGTMARYQACLLP